MNNAITSLQNKNEVLVTIHKGKHDETEVSVVDGVPQNITLTFWKNGNGYKVTRITERPSGTYEFTGETEIFNAGELNFNNYGSRKIWHDEVWSKSREVEVAYTHQEDQFVITK